MSEITHPPIEYMPDEPVEQYKLGTVESIRQITAAEVGIRADLAPGYIFEVNVSDPYVSNLDSATIIAARAREDQADAQARERRLEGKWERQHGTTYVDSEGNTRDKRIQWGDPVSHNEFFGEMNSEALKMWLSNIPSANALTYLSDPETIQVITHRNGKVSAEVDDVARLWLTACTDAVAIRNRGTVMAELVKGYIDEMATKGQNLKADTLKWMSVACGTALPTMKAAQRAGVEPELFLIDYDENVLKATEDLGRQINFTGSLKQERVNIFSSDDMAQLRGLLGGNGDRPRIIDLMGIFEYTGEHTGIDSAEFLRSNYDMLHPGGRLILGQMRDDRPNPDFTMGVVGWPFIVMRSPEEVMQTIKDAGISTDSAKLYLSEDGVYTVCAIDKPEGYESFANQTA